MDVGLTRTKHYDVVIVGGGHNGLTCGAYLARGGLSVCVLERRHLQGGGAVTEELWPGFRINTASHLMGLMQPKIILDLELQKFGYRVLPLAPSVQPLADGSNFIHWGKCERFAAELGRYSTKDAEAYLAYDAMIVNVGKILREFLWEVPFDPRSLHPLDLFDRLRFFWRHRAAARVFSEIAELFTASAFDFLSRRFESPEALATLGYYPSAAGLRIPGSAFKLLRNGVRDPNTSAGPAGVMQGGMGAISDAIAASGKRHGLEVRTRAEVVSILSKHGRASGVALASGEEIEAGIVVANAAARTTFLDLVDHKLLPDNFVREIRAFQTPSTAFKLHLALDRLPSFNIAPSLPAELGYPAQFRISPDLEYLESSYDAAQAGKISETPYITVLMQSVPDPSLAPEGKHVVSIYGGHVPFKPSGDWNQGERQTLIEAVLNRIEEHAPGFRSAILHQQLLTPTDYENIFGLPGGHPMHADVGFDKTFFRRPALGWSDYRSPVPGLYLASSSTHPGGGVTGVPGHNAAQVILADRKRGRWH